MRTTRLSYNDVIQYIDDTHVNLTELGKRCNSKKYTGNCYFFPKTGVNRLVRQLSQSYAADGMTISEDAFTALHVHLEHLATELLLQSIVAMTHAKRVTVMHNDVVMAISCKF
jgi:histone H3/H4